MTILQAILLGIIQGLTEFLPISSTAHLTLAGKIFGLIDSQRSAEWTAFIAVMQLGTLAAVLLYFRHDLASILRSILRDAVGFKRKDGRSALGKDSWMGLYMIFGTIPIVVVGWFFKDTLHGMITKSTVVIICSLVGLALLLWLAEKVATHKRTIQQVKLVDALVVGLAQCLALIPGSSRSGSTITAGLFMNLRREAAARFSFLLSIPAVFLSGVYELIQVWGTLDAFGFGNLIVATIVSAVSGYAAIAWLLHYLSNHSVMIFVWYRIALGAVLGVLLYTGLIQA